ncbi:MAG: uroporphyrinogen decarboxylase family protein, partial [Deltaproteobacteria bacterium]|nr:uroporphyrinogen decarboxylase family protein [Deltaproteobacteria bacterium]
AVFRRFRPDSVTVNAGLQCVAEALGAKFRFPEYGPPVIEAPGLSSYDDADELDGLSASSLGRLPNFFSAWEDVSGRIGSEVVVDFSLGGPFTTAVYLVGLDKILRGIVRQPDSVRKVLRLTTDAVKSVFLKAHSLGAAAGLAEPMASCAVISPSAFRSFAKEPLEEISALAKELYGRGLGLHICGKSRKIWPDLAEIGLSGFSLDNIESLSEAKASIGSKLTLIGNVPPIEVLKDGTPEETAASAKACLDAAKDSPKGFILASGCEILVDTPPENIDAMMDAARLYGRLD